MGFEIRNDGVEACRLTPTWRCRPGEAPEAPEAPALPSPLELAAGATETVTVFVRFERSGPRPLGCSPACGGLEWSLVDPSGAVVATAAIHVAPPPGPELLASPDPVLFGAQGIGCRRARSVALFNIGPVPLVVEAVEVEGLVGELAFAVETPDPLPGLARGDVLTLEVMHAPARPGRGQAELRIEARAEIEGCPRSRTVTTTARVQLTGQGVDVPCPGD